MIIDDDEFQIQLLERRLELKHEYVRVVATAENIKEGFEKIVLLKPNLIFLDVEMPGGSGIELAQLIRKNNINTKIVIVSAKKKYAYEAIQNSVFDYIHKPYTIETLSKTLKRINLDELLIDLDEQRAILMEDIFGKISFKVGSKDYFVRPTEIVYCETNRDKITLVQFDWMDKPILVTETLNSLEEKLPKALFFKIRTSILINIKYVHKIKRTSEECILRTKKETFSLSGKKEQLNKLRTVLQEAY